MESLTMATGHSFAQSELPSLSQLKHHFNQFAKNYNSRLKERKRKKLKTKDEKSIVPPCRELGEHLIWLAYEQIKKGDVKSYYEGVKIKTYNQSFATRIGNCTKSTSNHIKILSRAGLITNKTNDKNRIVLEINLAINEDDYQNDCIRWKNFLPLVLEAQGAPEREKITYTADSIFLNKNESQNLEQKKELDGEKSWSKIYEEQIKELDSKTPEKEKHVRNGRKLLFRKSVNQADAQGFILDHKEPQEQKKIEKNISLSSQESLFEVKNSSAELKGKEELPPIYFKNLQSSQIDSEVLAYGEKIWSQINDKIYCGYFSKNHQNTDWGFQCAKIVLYIHQKLGKKEVSDTYLKTQKLIFYIKRWIDKTHVDSMESDKIKRFVPGPPSYYLDICEEKGTRFINALQWEFDFNERKSATNARITIEHLTRKCRQGKSNKDAIELHQENLKMVKANPLLTNWYQSNIQNFFPNGFNFKR